MTKIRSIGLLILVMVVVSGVVCGQSVDDIIAAHIRAMGGREKLMSLKTVRITSDLFVQGNRLTQTWTASQLVGARLEVTGASLSIVQVLTPNTGWSRSSLNSNKLEPTSAEDSKAGLRLLDIQSPLLDAKAKGTTVELIGKEDVDGTADFKLKLTFSNGHVCFYFLDPRSCLVEKITEQRIEGGQPVEVITMYSDYKKNAEGFMFPYSTLVSGFQTKTLNIQTNVPVDPSIFTAK